MYTARCDERKGRRSGCGACPRRFRSVHQLASGVAAFRAIAWRKLHGAKWMANDRLPSPPCAGRVSVSQPGRPIVAEALSLSDVSGKRACFYGARFSRERLFILGRAPGRQGVQRAIAASSPL